MDCQRLRSRVRVFVALFSSLAAGSVLVAGPASASVERNVILLMLDGVRWQEASNDKIFERMWAANRQPGAVMVGGLAMGWGPKITVGNAVILSLPAYESITTGVAQYCFTNWCGRVRDETLQERLVRELGDARERVATIASWKQLRLAAERRSGATEVNVALEPLDADKGDPEADELNARQRADLPPWSGSRWDKYTFAHGLRYIKTYQPRFLMLQLVDSDEWGHRGNYANYVQTLQNYDQWIAVLKETLANLGEYGRNTTLIVTTDHGRGNGQSWNNHGVLQKESKNIWMHVAGEGLGGSVGPRTKVLTHLDLRPTIESILGLKPKSCRACGRAIAALVPKE